MYLNTNKDTQTRLHNPEKQISNTFRICVGRINFTIHCSLNHQKFYLLKIFKKGVEKKWSFTHYEQKKSDGGDNFTYTVLVPGEDIRRGLIINVKSFSPGVAET